MPTRGPFYEIYPTSRATIDSVVLDSTHTLVLMGQSGAAQYAKVITHDRTAMVVGPEYEVVSSSGSYSSLVMLSSTSVLIFILEYGTSYITARVATITNGDEISFGSTYYYDSAISGYFEAVRISSTSALLYLIRNTGDKSCIVTVSGSVVTFQTSYDIDIGLVKNEFLDYIDSTHILLGGYCSDNNYKAAVITIGSGYALSVGSTYTAGGTGSSNNDGCHGKMVSSTEFMMFYSDSASSYKCIIGTISSGDVISFGTAVATTSKKGANVVLVKTETDKALVIFTPYPKDGWYCQLLGINGTDIEYGDETADINNAYTHISANMIDADLCFVGMVAYMFYAHAFVFEKNLILSTAQNGTGIDLTWERTW